MSLRAQVRSAAGLWYSLGDVLVVFLAVVLPLAIWLPAQSGKEAGQD